MENGSYWWHQEGICYEGPDKDEMLDPMPVVHCSWGDWKKMHPDTGVLADPKDPKHRDPRGGHGSEEYWERPGIDQMFVYTFYEGDMDRQLPENVMVMGVNVPEGVRVYPFRDIKLEGGLVNDELGGVPLLVVSGPSPESFFTGVFDRRVGDQVLEFKPQGERLVDQQTNSVWNSEGLAIEGQLKGTQLNPVHYSFTRWHSWIYTHPKTEIYRAKRTEAPDIEEGIFARVLEGFRETNHEVRIKRELHALERQLQSDRGLIIDIDGDRFLLHHFVSATAARDWAALTPYAVQAGLYVLQSSPPEQFADIALSNARLPDQDIKWSKLVGDQDFVSRFQRAAPKEDAEDYPGFSDIIGGLNSNGYDCSPGAPELHAGIVHWAGWGTYVGLRPGEENWFTVTIEGSDFFEVHRFKTVEGAEEFKNFAKHAFRVGRYVFYSTPQNRFILTRFRMVDRPEATVNWSEFLEDEDFKKALHAIIKE
jgi:hypothetical protein